MVSKAALAAEISAYSDPLLERFTLSGTQTDISPAGTTLLSPQAISAVALEDGTFVTAVPLPSGVELRRFDADLQPLGAPITYDDPGGGRSVFQDIAELDNGGYAIAVSIGTGQLARTYIQRFEADGTEVGTPVQAFRTYPHATREAKMVPVEGGIAVASVSTHDSKNWNVFQILDNDAEPVMQPIEENAFGTPAFALEPLNGSHLNPGGVVWGRSTGNSNNREIVFEAFDNQGQTVGEPGIPLGGSIDLPRGMALNGGQLEIFALPPRGLDETQDSFYASFQGGYLLDQGIYSSLGAYYLPNDPRSTLTGPDPTLNLPRGLAEISEPGGSPQWHRVHELPDGNALLSYTWFDGTAGSETDLRGIILEGSNDAAWTIDRRIPEGRFADMGSLMDLQTDTSGNSLWSDVVFNENGDGLVLHYDGRNVEIEGIHYIPQIPFSLNQGLGPAGWYAATLMDDRINGSDLAIDHSIPDEFRLYAGDDLYTRTGNAKVDIVRAGAGEDTVLSGGGNDTVFGGTGADVALLGAGGDLYNDATGILGGNDTAYGEGGRDTLNGGAGRDQLWGEAGRDELNGGTGRDVLRGGNGNDTLNGNGGGDKLFGDNGADVLNGGGGRDTLEGGFGADVLTGGGGADAFRFEVGEGRNNQITDFDVSQDILQVSNFLYSGPRLSLQELIDTFATTTAGGTRFTFETGDAVLLVGVTDTTTLADAMEYFN